MRPPAHKTRLVQLAKEHGGLAARVAELRHQLTEAERVLRGNELEMASYAPVYTLPNDVLKLILEELYEHNFGDQDTCCTTPHQDPLSITHTSRRWRAVALSLPTIWTCMHLSRPHRLLRLWAERSAPLPIRVTCVFRETEQGGRQALKRYYARLRAILEHASRLQHLSLSTDEPEFVCGVCELLQNQDLSALLTLALRYEASFTGGAATMSYIQLPTCPNLKSLTLTAIPYHNSLVSCSLPRLEALQLDGCGYLNSSSLDTISKAAPALVELILKGAWPVLYLYDDTSEPILLSELPSVKQLILHCYTVPRARMSTAVAQLFLHTPASTILTLRDTEESDVILRGLADDDAAQMLPLLECLELTVLVGGESGYSGLLHFLEKRESFGHPLKELRLGQTLQEEMGAELLRSLGKLVAVSVL